MAKTEKAMTTHSSTLAWKIPWVEEPGRLQYIGSRRVGHNWATSLSLFTFMHWRRKWKPTPMFLLGKSHGWRSLVGCSPWGHEELDTAEQPHFHFSLSCIGEGNGNPLQCSCLENPRDRGAWKAAVHGVAKSRTWLSDFTFTFHFHALEKEMETHSSVLAWKIPGTGEPSGLLSMGSHRVGHDWNDLAVAAILFTVMSCNFSMVNFWNIIFVRMLEVKKVVILSWQNNKKIF